MLTGSAPPSSMRPPPLDPRRSLARSRAQTLDDAVVVNPESGIGKDVLECHRGKAKLTVREAAPELTAADVTASMFTSSPVGAQYNAPGALAGLDQCVCLGRLLEW